MSGMEVWKHLKSGLETNFRVGRSKMDKLVSLVEELGNILKPSAITGFVVSLCLVNLLRLISLIGRGLTWFDTQKPHAKVERQVHACDTQRP